MKVVGRQGMDRDRWDSTLTWMSEKHNMPAPDAETRKLLLDYLKRPIPPPLRRRAGLRRALRPSAEPSIAGAHRPGRVPDARRAADGGDDPSFAGLGGGGGEHDGELGRLLGQVLGRGVAHRIIVLLEMALRPPRDAADILGEADT